MWDYLSALRVQGDFHGASSGCGGGGDTIPAHAQANDYLRLQEKRGCTRHWQAPPLIFALLVVWFSEAAEYVIRHLFLSTIMAISWDSKQTNKKEWIISR